MPAGAYPLARPLLKTGSLSLYTRSLLPPPRNHMARSLHVKHDEKLGTSPLLNAFLVLAIGWMVGGAWLSSIASGV